LDLILNSAQLHLPSRLVLVVMVVAVVVIMVVGVGVGVMVLLRLPQLAISKRLGGFRSLQLLNIHQPMRLRCLLCVAHFFQPRVVYLHIHSV